MIIRTKVTLYAGEGDNEGVIRIGTVGVEVKRIVRFYDVSGKYFVAFSRQDCIEQKTMFECRQSVGDREVALSDVLKVLESHHCESVIPEIIGL